MEANRPDEWALANCLVVDLSTEIAGPYCSKLLADAGADVIKVEDPIAGDPLRRWVASNTPLPEGEDGALFQFLNASKRGIALDLEQSAGRGDLFELVGRADVLVESFGPGGLAERQISKAALWQKNPGLSIVSISPWGLEGPEASRPATEFTLQAATGSIAYRGLPDRKPVAAGGRIGEWAAGSYAAVGAMSALLSARTTGRGQHVDLSIFETMLLCLTVYHDLNGQWVDGPLARSIEVPSIEPTKDGYVGICAITGQQWTDFCSLLERPEIGKDPRYLDGRARMQHLDLMREMIQSWTQERTTEEIIELCSLLRIPAAQVGHGRSLPEMEQMKERGVFRPGPHQFLQPRPPYLLGRTPMRPPTRAPRLDEHGDAIRRENAESGRGGGRIEKKVDPDANPLPLDGLRVLDLTAFWAGPVATCYLADMGADVIKVESIQRPDGMRFAGAIPNESLWEWSPVFHGANPGKRAITLQLDSDEGMALLHRLIERSEILIENYSARVLENFGLGWEEIRAINPGIIMARMPAFGLDGPWRDRPGFAMTVEQVSGLAWLTGYRDLPLVIRGACDPIGGMHAVFALLMALEHKKRTGEGQLVEIPLVEVAINMAAEQVIEFSAYEQLLERDENRGPVAAPQGVYRTANPEDLIALAIPDDESWAALCELMGRGEWLQSESYASAAGRRTHHDRIDEAIEAWLSQHSREAVLLQLLEAGIPAASLINPHSLMPNPQLEARAFFQIMEHSHVGKARYPGWPMAFSGLPRALHQRPPPTLGQHNDEVLGTILGLDGETLDRLRKDKVIGERPSFM
jgi:crotonobetainyl-CoA:carnitine CoA-transferase CaiB-like acyl-CoA transferase